MKRKVVDVINASPVNMGGDLTTWQPLPKGQLNQVDPFLLLHHTGPDVFPPNNNGLPFGPHPHRGFETVTFIFEGNVVHKDSTGIVSKIEKGGVQWMTAARGIVHTENVSEDFRISGGDVEYIQLWINLPAKFKMHEPSYNGLQRKDIPQLTTDNGKVKINVIAGKYEDTDGPVHSLTDIHAQTLFMDNDASLMLKTAENRNVLLYVMNGEAIINDRQVKGRQLVQLDNSGEDINIKTTDFTKILYCTGLPINEPVVSHGPFVMNSSEEILQAIRDYQSGKMGVLSEETY